MKVEFDFTKPVSHYASLNEASKCIDVLWLNSHILQKENEELQKK